MLLSYSTCPLECLKYGRRRPLDFDLNFVWRKNSLFLILPVTFNARLDQGERKRDKQAEDQPCINHFSVRRWWELLYLAGEDGRHHQHDGQVHCKARLKVDWLEEGGGV